MIIYFVILMVLPLWAQHKVKSNYEKYSQVRSTSGKTGQEVALEILHANGIYDVDVVEGQGFLTTITIHVRKYLYYLQLTLADLQSLVLLLLHTKLVMQFNMRRAISS